jgi:hypothetical protein
VFYHLLVESIFQDLDLRRVLAGPCAGRARHGCDVVGDSRLGGGSFGGSKIWDTEGDPYIP